METINRRTFFAVVIAENLLLHVLSNFFLSLCKSLTLENVIFGSECIEINGLLQIQTSISVGFIANFICLWLWGSVSLAGLPGRFNGPFIFVSGHNQIVYIVQDPLYRSVSVFHLFAFAITSKRRAKRTYPCV